MVIDKLESINDITRNGVKYVRFIGYCDGETDKTFIVDISRDEIEAQIVVDDDDTGSNKLYPAAVETLKTGPHAAFKFDILSEYNSGVLVGYWPWESNVSKASHELTVFIPSPEDWYPELGVDLVTYLAEKIAVMPDVKITLTINGYCLISDKWTSGKLIDTFVYVSDKDSDNVRQIVIGALHKLLDICKTRESYSEHISSAFAKPYCSDDTRKNNNLATRIVEDFLFD